MVKLKLEIELTEDEVNLIREFYPNNRMLFEIKNWQKPIMDSLIQKGLVVDRSAPYTEFWKLSNVLVKGISY